MVCPNCQYALSPFDKECPRCKPSSQRKVNPYIAIEEQRQRPAAMPSAHTIYECEKCGRPLPPSVNRCPSCGDVFEQAVPADAEIPTGRFRAVAPGAAQNGYSNEHSYTAAPILTVPAPPKKSPLTALGMALRVVGVLFLLWIVFDIIITATGLQDAQSSVQNAQAMNAAVAGSSDSLSYNVSNHAEGIRA